MLNKSQDDDLVMSLVELALACSPEERPNYLRSACGDDTKLLEQVRSYVEWEERMNGFLLDPLYPQARDEPRLEPDDLLDGRFRIIREIAQGGMESVNVAAWSFDRQQRWMRKGQSGARAAVIVVISGRGF